MVEGRFLCQTVTQISYEAFCSCPQTFCDETTKIVQIVCPLKLNPVAHFYFLKQGNIQNGTYEFKKKKEYLSFLIGKPQRIFLILQRCVNCITLELMHLALYFRYRTRTGWRAHEAYVHTKQLNFKCDEPGCDKAYLCENDLVVHKRKHSGELPFTCSYCGNRYISAHSLAQHEKAAHLQTEVSFLIFFLDFQDSVYFIIFLLRIIQNIPPKVLKE